MSVRKVINRLIIVTALATTFSIFAFVNISHAEQSEDDINWVGSTLKYSEYPNQELFPPNNPNDCVSQQASLDNGYGKVKEITICLHAKDDWSYGKYHYWEPTWWGGSDYVEGYAARLGRSGSFHRLQPGLPSLNYTTPETDNIVMTVYRSDSNFYLYGYRNFKDKLVEVALPSGEIQYTYDTKYDLSVKSPEGAQYIVENTPGLSNNGKWLAFETSGSGFFRVNLETLKMKRFTDLAYRYYMWWGPSTEFAVSNDGRHVAVMGSGSDMSDHPGYRLYDISDDCGDPSEDYTVANKPMKNPCPMSSFEDVVKSNYPVYYATKPRFDDKGGQLTLQLVSSYGSPKPKWIQLSPKGYVPEPHITYLALGDSYSSGEGDITDGRIHYLKGTSDMGGCHISDRSYPFLLRDHYSIPSQNMRSVACSGAQVVFDYIGENDNYMGQSNQLKKLSISEKNKRRESALNNFTPGIVKQINFIKKYKPSVVTFTGGGNDVGFSSVIRYCAEPLYEYVPISYECSYADENSDLYKILHRSIDSQYYYNKAFIEQVKEASPKTRIVMIGYPSFIASSGLVLPTPAPGCGLNGGMLSNNEINMINSAVTRMDDMLQRLAYDTHISYVDVEDSLEGGHVCEYGNYVNGVLDLGLKKLEDNYLDESFHPNSKGHRKIADTIISSGALTEDKIPEPGSYTKFDDYERTEPRSFIDTGKIIIGQIVSVFAGTGTFSPNTSVDLEMFSDRIDLGKFTSEADGSMNIELDTRNMPPGSHVLIARGVGNDGKPVSYYQFIEILDKEAVAMYAESSKVGSGSKESSADDKKEYSKYSGSMSQGQTFNENDRSLLNSDNDNSRKESEPDYKNSDKDNFPEELPNKHEYIVIIVPSLIIGIGGLIYYAIKKTRN